MTFSLSLLSLSSFSSLSLSRYGHFYFDPKMSYHPTAINTFSLSLCGLNMKEGKSGIEHKRKGKLGRGGARSFSFPRVGLRARKKERKEGSPPPDPGRNWGNNGRKYNWIKRLERRSAVSLNPGTVERRGSLILCVSACECESSILKSHQWINTRSPGTILCRSCNLIGKRNSINSQRKLFVTYFLPHHRLLCSIYRSDLQQIVISQHSFLHQVLLVESMDWI